MYFVIGDRIRIIMACVRKVLIIGIILVQVGACWSFTKVAYPLTSEPIDVVIPAVDKDIPTLELCIEGIRKYGENIRRIIVVSDKKLTDKAEWFDEKNYPFAKRDIALEIFGGNIQKAEQFIESPVSRTGWIFAQCLKMYAFIVIPGISSNVLMLDSDTIFISPVKFLNEKGGGLYNTGTEHQTPYFEHMSRLLPGLRRVFHQHSGIAHHMLFQRPILEDLFTMVSHRHKTDFWRAMCRCINQRHLYGATMQDYGSPCSEYEIYFNFAFDRTNQVEIRPLRWENVGDFNAIPKFQAEGYHQISCHAHLRQ